MTKHKNLYAKSIGSLCSRKAMGYDALSYASQLFALMFWVRAIKNTVSWIPLSNYFDCCTRFDYRPIIFALDQVNCNNAYVRVSSSLQVANADRTTKHAEKQKGKQRLKANAKKKVASSKLLLVLERVEGQYRPKPEGLHEPHRACSSRLVEEQINTSHFLHIYLTYARLALRCVCRLMWH